MADGTRIVIICLVWGAIALACYGLGLRMGIGYVRNYLKEAARNREMFIRVMGEAFAVVNAEDYEQGRRAGLITPELLQPYHADAAMAWLKRMGVHVTSDNADTTTLEVVRAVVKAVREAQP